MMSGPELARQPIAEHDRQRRAKTGASRNADEAGSASGLRKRPCIRAPDIAERRANHHAEQQARQPDVG